jgi:hypothetical protein
MVRNPDEILGRVSAREDKTGLRVVERTRRASWQKRRQEGLPNTEVSLPATQVELGTRWAQVEEKLAGRCWGVAGICQLGTLDVSPMTLLVQRH